MLWLPAALLQASLTPPATRADDLVDQVHGVPVPDPYRWLEDQNAPETRAWIDQQNAYARTWLDEIPFREPLRERLEELMRRDVISSPTIRGERYFLWKRSADQELMVLYLRQGADGEDEVLLDPHTMSDDLTTSVTTMGLSLDGSLLAYGIRRGGEDEVELHFLDIDTREELPLVMPKDRYTGLAMLPDKSGFYYGIYGGSAPRVYYRDLAAESEPVEVFGEGYGEGVLLNASLSENGRWLLVHIWYGSAAKKNELYLKDLTGDGPFQTIVKDVEARFDASVADDTMYIHSNFEAPNWRLYRAACTAPARENWVEVLPERDYPLEGVSLVGGHLAASYLEHVVSRIEVFTPAGELVRTITGPTLGSLSGLGGRWSQPTAFYSFSSYHVPGTIYQHEVASGEESVWWQADVPIDPDSLEVRQVWYPSRDGTRVPMFLCHRKGLEPDGERPVYLTAYGGFNASLTPGFSANAAIWAAAGGIFAQPNLRGGGEFGEAWHEAGMREHKQNVFDDFVSAAEYLIAEGWTKPDRLAIAGGSNGGLLVGAALTQRPDLYRAVLCTYPLLDMVRYHQFLVAHFWVPEYGSSENADEFAYLHAYSPYHRVVAGRDYPATMFMTGDADTRVDPLHARKMAALLQRAQGAARPVILHYETKAGHSGGKPLAKIIDDQVDSLGFLMWQVGMDIPGR